MLIFGPSRAKNIIIYANFDINNKNAIKWEEYVT